MKNARITAQRFLLRLPNGRHVLGSESQHGACREMQEAVRIKSSCKEKLGILEKSEIWTFYQEKLQEQVSPGAQLRGLQMRGPHHGMLMVLETGLQDLSVSSLLWSNSSLIFPCSSSWNGMLNLCSHVLQV